MDMVAGSGSVKIWTSIDTERWLSLRRPEGFGSSELNGIVDFDARLSHRTGKRV